MELDENVFAMAPLTLDRRRRRRRVLWPAEIVSRPGIRCTVLDISIAGARMRVNKPLAEGETIVVRSSRFTAKAQIAWTAEGYVGLAFIEPNERLEKALDAP